MCRCVHHTLVEHEKNWYCPSILHKGKLIHSNQNLSKNRLNQLALSSTTVIKMIVLASMCFPYRLLDLAVHQRNNKIKVPKQLDSSKLHW